jgi:hypothetical protein
MQMQWPRLFLVGISWSIVRSLQVTLVPEPVQAYFVLGLYDVGLAPGAVLWVNITNALPSNGTVLVVLSRNQWREWLTNQVSPLPVGNRGPDNLTFSSYLISNWRHPFVSRLVAKYTLRATKPDRYYIGILNVHREVMLIGGTISYVNPEAQQLPLQLAHFPDLMWVSSIAFGALAMAAALLLSLRRVCCRVRFTRLHMLLCGCVYLKSVVLALQWAYFFVLSLEGVAPLWGRQLWQSMSKFHEVFQIGWLLITALGWRRRRPRLSSVEVKFTTLAVCLALLLAALQVGSEAAGSDVGLVSFRLLFYIVKVMFYLLIIFVINVTLLVIKVQLAESPVTAAVAVFYQKQEAFIILRRVFLALVFQPSVLLWLQLSMLNQADTEWLVTAINEVWGFFIYVGLLAAIWPGRQKHLLRLVLESEIAAALEEVDTHQVADAVDRVWTGAALEEAEENLLESEIASPEQQPGAEPTPVFGEAVAAAADEAAANTTVGNLDLDITAPYMPLAGGD